MNMVQPLLNAVSPQAVQSLAGALHETPEHTRQGLADALPMIFASLIGKGSTTQGAAGLLAMMRDGNVDAGLVDRFSSGQQSAGLIRDGGSIAERLLGTQFGGAADAIAQHAGVARGSAQALLGLAAPLALGGIAKAAPTTGFTPEGLMRFLQGQQKDVSAMAPLKVVGSHQTRTAPPERDVVRERPNRMLLWLGGLLLAGLVALMVGQCANQRVEAPPTARVEAPVVPVPELRSRIDLPGGVTLNLAPNSIGDRLATYLRGVEPAPRTFAFENLNFDTGEVVLTPESIATLDAIASILKAYPNTAVRLDGHTDSTGDPAANVTLSQGRANSIARALTQRGVDPARLTTAGYGSARPLATNDTEAGRAQNRRLELTVTNK